MEESFPESEDRPFDNMREQEATQDAKAQVNEIDGGLGVKHTD